MSNKTRLINQRRSSIPRDFFKTAYDSLEDHYDEFKRLCNEVLGLIDDDEFDEQDVIIRDFF